MKRLLLAWVSMWLGGCVFLPGEGYPCAADGDCLPPFITCDESVGRCGLGNQSTASSSSSSSGDPGSSSFMGGSSSGGVTSSSSSSSSGSSSMVGMSSSVAGNTSSSSSSGGVCDGGNPNRGGVVAPACTSSPVAAPMGTWVDGAEGTNVYGLATTVDAAGNIYAGGSVYSAADLFGVTLPSEVRRDFFITSLDGAGTRRWFTRWTTAANDEPYVDVVALTPDGQALYVMGLCRGSLTLVGGDGTKDLACDMGGSTYLARLEAGTGAVTSVALLTRPLESVAFLHALPGGDLVLGATYQTRATFPGNQSVNSAGTRDMVVARFAADLSATRWVKGFGSDNEDRVGGGALDGRGNLYVAGTYGNTLQLGAGGPMVTFHGYSDAILVKLNVDTGALAWHRELAGSGFDDAFGVTVSTDGTPLWFGAYADGADLNGTQLVSASERAGFLARVAPDNSAVDAVTFEAAGYNAIVSAAPAPCGGGIRLATVVQIDMEAGCGLVPAATPPDGAMVLLELDGQLRTRWAQSFLAGGADSYAGAVYWLGDGSSVLTGQVRRSFSVGTTMVTSTGWGTPFVLRVAAP